MYVCTLIRDLEICPCWEAVLFSGSPQYCMFHPDSTTTHHIASICTLDGVGELDSQTVHIREDGDDAVTLWLTGQQLHGKAQHRFKGVDPATCQVQTYILDDLVHGLFVVVVVLDCLFVCLFMSLFVLFMLLLFVLLLLFVCLFVLLLLLLVVVVVFGRGEGKLEN